MNPTSPSAPGGGRAQARQTPQGQPQQDAEPSQAGEPADVQAHQDRGRYSASLQTSQGQGQVSGRGGRSQAEQAPALRPAVDIFEDEGGVTLLADLPGVPRDKLELRVDGDNLVIEGTAEVPEVAEMELVHGELLSPHFQRSFTLSRDLDPNHIEATLENGVLRLRLHKAEQAKPRRIEVQAR